MKIRLLPLIIGGGGLALSASALPPVPPTDKPAPSHAGGSVTMPLEDLKALWERAQVRPARDAEPPPLRALLQKLELEVQLHPERCTGVARVVARSLVEGWQEVELFGGDLSIDSTEDEALLKASPECYVLMMEKPGARTLEFAVSMPGTNHWSDGVNPKIHLPQATVRNVVFKNIPAGFALLNGDKHSASGGSGEARLALPALVKSLDLRLESLNPKVPGAAAMELAQVTVPLLKCSQRLVMDGGLLTTAEFSFRHRAMANLTLTLPPGADILQCALEGSAVKPSLRENEIDITLSGTTGEEVTSRLQLSYFTKLEPLNQTSGRITLSLPGTALFHERMDWAISLPDGMAATALESNADSPAAVQGAQEIALRREFWRGGPVTAEVFYQKQKP